VNDSATADQVVRLAHFREAHPAVRVSFERPLGRSGFWLATWTSGEGSIMCAVELDLEHLLDRLGREMGEPS
jgi:hypothetical protein